MRPLTPVLAACLAVTACTPKYIAPTTGPVAELRVRMESPEAFAMIHTYEGPGCQGPQAIGLVGGPGYVKAENDPDRGIRPNMPGSSGKPDPQVIETVVPAEKRLTLLYSQIGPHGYQVVRTCKIPISFVPRANEQYEVRYRYTPPTCGVQVFLLSLDADRKVLRTPVESITRESDSCIPTKF